MVTGTFTESNDEYSILIKVISTKKGYSMLGSARGSITKTPFILKLEEVILQGSMVGLIQKL